MEGQVAERIVGQEPLLPCRGDLELEQLQAYDGDVGLGVFDLGNDGERRLLPRARAALAYEVVPDSCVAEGDLGAQPALRQAREQVFGPLLDLVARLGNRWPPRLGDSYPRAEDVILLLGGPIGIAILVLVVRKVERRLVICARPLLVGTRSRALRTASILVPSLSSYSSSYPSSAESSRSGRSLGNFRSKTDGKLAAGMLPQEIVGLVVGRLVAMSSSPNRRAAGMRQRTLASASARSGRARRPWRAGQRSDQITSSRLAGGSPG